MKRQITASLTFAAATLLLLSALSALSAQVQDKGAVALKAAMDKETLEGDPKGAIEQYKKIAQSKDPAIAARALVGVGDCYRTLGDSIESRKIYEKVLRDYKDQKESVALVQARLSGTEQSAGPVSRTVWNSAAFGVDSGTLSRDGRFFSYSQNFELVIHEIATGMDRKLTNRSAEPGSVAESVVSPDGKRIAYIWSGRGEKGYSVRLADLTGNPNPRQLYYNPDVYNVFLQDWSPDGQWLAIEVHRIDKTVQIALLPASGGTPRVLKSIDWSANPDDKVMYGTYFSGDGKYLGYDMAQSNASRERNVYALAVDGSREIPVVEQTGKNEMVGWSPDRKWILFKSDHSGTTDLWAVAFSDGKVQGTPQRLKANVGESFHPIGWAPSGALYYQTRNGGIGSSKVQLDSLDFATGKLLSMSVPSTRGYQENTRQPVWSPDSKRLAFLSQMRDRSSSDALIIRATDTGTVHELSTKQLIAISAIYDWTPDGRSLLVHARDVQNRLGMYRVDVETGSTAALILDQPGMSFSFESWMPDGLSFVASVSSKGLYRVDLQTGEVSEFLTGNFMQLYKFSPNGKSAYYGRPDSSNKAYILMARDLTTGSETELASRPPLVGGPTRFSPDGRYFTFTGIDAASNSRVLQLMSTGGAIVRELMRVPAGVKTEDLSKWDNGQSIDVLSWAPDSRSLLLRKNMNDPGKSDELVLVSIDGQPQGGISIPNKRPISPSPDNRYAAYTLTEAAPPATVEVSVLENFLPKTTAGSK
jgi:Tol biopolymer transport system component